MGNKDFEISVTIAQIADTKRQYYDKMTIIVTKNMTIAILFQYR